MTSNSAEPIQAYPLQWPPGWRRKTAQQRTSGRFRDGNGAYKGESWRSASRVEVWPAIQRILRELSLMGIPRDDIVISTNIPTRLDGMPRGDARAPSDPGAAVYWRRGKATQCMAIDRYDRCPDNLAAIAATLEAMRAIERHGGAEILDRAFTGFIALPAPEQPFQVLGVKADATRDEVERAHSRLAMRHHPDRGGDVGTMARINTARDAMLERLAP